jgi:hypothetical protein
MSLQRLERIYLVGLLVIFGGIVLHAPLSVGFGVVFPDFALAIKSWKEILMVLLVPLAIYIVSRRKLWDLLRKDTLFWLVVAYAILHILVMAMFWQGFGATLAGLAIDLRYILFFALVYSAVLVLPEMRKYGLIVTTAGAFIVVGFATIQLFLPPDILRHIGYGTETIMPYLTVDKNLDFIRVNSTLRGPNPLGAYAGIVLGLAAAFAVRHGFANEKKRHLAWALLIVLAVIALWVSYSRSALVGAIVTVLLVLATVSMRKLSLKMWIGIVTTVLILAGGLFAARETSFVSNVLLHENQAGGSAISSNDDHIKSLEYGVSQAIREPLGTGVGSTGSASLFGDKPVVVENQYLFTAHEVGLVGLALFGAILVIILKRLWNQKQDWLALGLFASGIGLSLIGLLLPVWADDTVSIIWWGLAGIALAGGGYARRKTK